MKNLDNQNFDIKARIDRLNKGEGNVKAYASISISDNFMVHNLRVMKSNKGMFVSMPTRSFTTANGETRYTEICHCTTADMRNAINSAVIDAYNEAIGQVNTEEASIEEPLEAKDLEEPVNVEVVATA